MSRAMLDLAGRLSIPTDVEAIAWDMDGVLLDSLSGDTDLCRASAKEIVGDGSWIDPAMVKRNFAFEPATFWLKLSEEAHRPLPKTQIDALVEAYDRRRAQAKVATLPGIEAILDACEIAGLPCVVASSNPLDVVLKMLSHAGIEQRFRAVSALTEGVAPKPAPDLYIQAARELGIAPAKCAFIEDSITGLDAGRAAGFGYAIAVATGAGDFAALARSGLADIVYDRFETPRIRFVDDTPTNKKLDTPNDFISHMLEHIAWRLGVGVELAWRSNDWQALGVAFGRELKSLAFRKGSTATLGMIDDGAAEVMIDFEMPPKLELTTHPTIDIAKVLAQRVEQVDAGADLKALLDGLAEGLDVHIFARICSFEDPHHSWEGTLPRRRHLPRPVAGRLDTAPERKSA